MCESASSGRNWTSTALLPVAPLSVLSNGEPRSRSRPNTHLPFLLLPQPTPQCNGPSAAGKQEAEDRDRGEEAESRAPKVMQQSPRPKQNGGHTKRDSVQHLGLEGDNPGHEPKSGHHQVYQDAPLLRYVRRLSLATYYDVVP